MQSGENVKNAQWVSSEILDRLKGLLIVSFGNSVVGATVSTAKRMPSYLLRGLQSGAPKFTSMGVNSDDNNRYCVYYHTSMHVRDTSS